jgi:dGTPase
MLYSDHDKARRTSETNQYDAYRSDFRRDYGRLLHSPSFRRLQGKTQLYPGKESDFFRNRLTHSAEVAQIAKAIASKINQSHLEKKGPEFLLDLDLIEFAGLAHDLGHPPFGHQGEEALDKCMMDHGGFEGNAQTLRLLSKIEKKILPKGHTSGIDKQGKDVRVGLNLCARTIASIIKYDHVIAYTEEERIAYAGSREKLKPVKGCYRHEEDLIDWVKKQVLNGKQLKKGQKFKTIECMIMDIADDIAYSTYDLEDSLKAGFVKPFDYLFPDPSILNKVTQKVATTLNDPSINNDSIIDVLHSIFKSVIHLNLSDITIDNDNFEEIHLYLMDVAYKTSNELATNGYLRNAFTSGLVGRFIDGIEFHYNSEIPALSVVELDKQTRLHVEILKTFNYHMQIESPRLKIVEFRGKEIVDKIFSTLTTNNGYELLPADYKELYLHAEEPLKYRIICDFISGMTDLYAVNFYGRLTSENPETIFKPY